jgi:hypothetical protein
MKSRIDEMRAQLEATGTSQEFIALIIGFETGEITGCCHQVDDCDIG